MPRPERGAERPVTAIWIFTNTAFVSAVQHRGDPRLLVVRARLKGDLKAFFGKNVIVKETRTADYRFRTIVSRPFLRLALLKAVDGIVYDNFKSSVQDRDRHDAYMGVWSVMHRAQNDELLGKRRAVFAPPSLFHDPFEEDDDAEFLDLMESRGFALSRPEVKQ